LLESSDKTQGSEGLVEKTLCFKRAEVLYENDMEQPLKKCRQEFFKKA